MIDQPDLQYESSARQKGFQIIAGIDEAGRGAWAGPIISAAVILPDDPGISGLLSGVRDSKLMTGKQRVYWAEIIKDQAAAWAVGVVTSSEIDEIGILPANRLSMQRAIESLSIPPDYHLFDFIHWKNCPFIGEKLVKGERKSLSIAAASVIAKTHRDNLMINLEEIVPGYDFYRHKGYGTKLHRQAIHKLGLSEIHRKSFNIRIEDRH
ncbi:MAG: ribonuclease HII [Chloroflexota bacterium]